MKKKIIFAVTAIAVVCCLIATAVSTGMLAFAAGDATPTAYIRGALIKETTGLRASELLEVATDGFKPNADLSYTYKIATTSSTKSARLNVYAGANMYTYGDEVTYTTTSSKNPATPTKAGCKYFALPDKWDSTSYGDFGKVEVTVTVTDKNNPDDTATCSYKGFGASDLKADVDGMIVVLFKGQDEKMTQLYGLNGVVHITCSNSYTKNGSVNDTDVATYSNNTAKLKGVATGITQMSVTVGKTSSCAFHRSQETSVTNTVYVVDTPVANSDGSVTIKKVPVGVDITIDGVTKTSAEGNQDLTFTGLTPSTQYQVEASVTDDETRHTAIAITTVTTPAVYSVTVNSTPTGFGTASANYTSCVADSKVIITPTPTNSDYAVDKITYKKGTSATTYTVAKDGSGNYSFTMPAANVTVTVTFKQVVFHAASIVVTPETATKYIGETLTLTATVNPENTTNKEVTWSSEHPEIATVDQTGKVTMVSAGETKIIATSKDNTSLSDYSVITVLKKVNGFEVQPSINNWVYGDRPSTPTCTVKGGTPVYTYEGRNGTTYGPSSNVPTKAGDYNLIVNVAESTEYQKIDTVKVPFSITKRPIVVSDITAEDKTYDGTTDAEIDCSTATLTGKVQGDNLTVSTTGAFTDANAGNDKTVNLGTLTLNGTDKNNYVLDDASKQQKTAKADILPKKHDDSHDNSKDTGRDNPGDFKASIEPISDKTYTGSAITPDDEVIVKDEKGNVIPSSQYDITYTDNTNVGTAKVKVTFKNNYEGVLNTTFNIVPKKHDDDHDNSKDKGEDNPGDFKASIEPISDKTYTGSAITPDDEIVVKDENGKVIPASEYDYEFKNNVEVGTAEVKITFKNNYEGVLNGSFNIVPRVHDDNHDNKKDKSDDNPGDFKAEIENIPDQTYTGSPLTPKPVVKDGDKVLEEGKDYKIVSYEDNTEVGTAKVNIEFIGNYSGRTTATFCIVAAASPKTGDTSVSLSILIAVNALCAAFAACYIVSRKKKAEI